MSVGAKKPRGWGFRPGLATAWLLVPCETLDEGQSLGNSWAGAGDMAIHSAPASGAQQRLTQTAGQHLDGQTEPHTQTKPGLEVPDTGLQAAQLCGYTLRHTHTYSRRPFTTSTQRDSVREVAEADLGWNRVGERR